MHRLLASLLILILILVSGCDVAMSEKPIFTGADTAGAPQFENGVWLLEDESDCHVDPAQRVSRWPEHWPSNHPSIFSPRSRISASHRRSRCGRSRFGASCAARAPGSLAKRLRKTTPESSFASQASTKNASQARKTHCGQLPLRAARPVSPAFAPFGCARHSTSAPRRGKLPLAF